MFEPHGATDATGEVCGDVPLPSCLSSGSELCGTAPPFSPSHAPLDALRAARAARDSCPRKPPLLERSVPLAPGEWTPFPCPLAPPGGLATASVCRRRQHRGNRGGCRRGRVLSLACAALRDEAVQHHPGGENPYSNPAPWLEPLAPFVVAGKWVTSPVLLRQLLEAPWRRREASPTGVRAGEAIALVSLLLVKARDQRSFEAFAACWPCIVRSVGHTCPLVLNPFSL